MSTSRPILILVDSFSLIFRAFYGYQMPMETVDGQPTNAVFGFTSMLLRLLQQQPHARFATVFDRGIPQERLDVLPAYKGNRSQTPPELTSQIPLMFTMLEKLGIPHVGVDGWEADDVIGSYAKNAVQHGYDVHIVTGDRDLFQLIDDHVSVLFTRKGVTQLDVMDAPAVEEKYGVTPGQYAMLAALRGDTSDNMPGVPRVGEKTATKLLQEFHDLDGIFANLDKISGKALPKNLEEHEVVARRNMHMTVINRNLPIPVPVDALCCALPDFDQARAFIEELELYQLVTEVETLFADYDETHRPPALLPAELDETHQELSSWLRDATVHIQKIHEATGVVHGIVVHPLVMHQPVQDSAVAWAFAVTQLYDPTVEDTLGLDIPDLDEIPDFPDLLTDPLAMDPLAPDPFAGGTTGGLGADPLGTASSGTPDGGNHDAALVGDPFLGADADGNTAVVGAAQTGTLTADLGSGGAFGAGAGASTVPFGKPVVFAASDLTQADYQALIALITTTYDFANGHNLVVAHSYKTVLRLLAQSVVLDVQAAALPLQDVTIAAFLADGSTYERNQTPFRLAYQWLRKAAHVELCDLEEFGAACHALLGQSGAGVYPGPADGTSPAGQADAVPSGGEAASVQDVPGVLAGESDTVSASGQSVAELMQYLGQEALALAQLQPLLARTLEADASWASAQLVDLPLVTNLVAMEEAGVHVDVATLQTTATVLSEQLGELETTMFTLAGEPFNLDSHREISHVLFETMGVEPTEPCRQGFTITAEALESRAADHPIVAAYLTYLNAKAILGQSPTPLMQHCDPQTQRIHPRVVQTVLPTGDNRLELANDLAAAVPNDATIGPSIRQVFIPGAGYSKLASFDYAHVELQLLATFAQDAALGELLASSTDPYLALGMQLLDFSSADAAEHRDTLKRVLYSLLFGQEAWYVAHKTGISQASVNIITEAFLTSFPNAHAWLEAFIPETVANGFVQTLAGRRHHLPDLFSSNSQAKRVAQQQAWELLFRGSAIDVMKMGINAVCARLQADQMKSRLVLQMHDELLFELAEGEEDAALTCITAGLQTYLPGPLGKTSPNVITYGVGASWAETAADRIVVHSATSAS